MVATTVSKRKNDLLTLLSIFKASYQCQNFTQIVKIQRKIRAKNSFDTADKLPRQRADNNYLSIFANMQLRISIKEVHKIPMAKTQY